MLHILLLILKILGIILLVLLGILLTILLVLLFVPVRYRLSGQYKECPEGRALVSWLFHILSVRLVYKDRAVLTVKIFGIPLLKRQVWPEEDGAFVGESPEPSEVRMASLGGPEDEVLLEEPLSEHSADPVHTPAETAELTPKQGVLKQNSPPPEGKTLQGERPETSQEGSRKPVQETGIGAGRESGQESVREPSSKDGIAARMIKKIYGWFSDRLSQIKAAVKNIRRSFRHARRQLQKALDFWNNEENQKTFRLLIRQTKRLFKHLLPRKVKGRVCFGFEDPYYTGQVLTVVSPFYGLYARSLSIEPVFGEKALEGDLEIRGYIRLGTLLLIVLRVFANKNFRILLKKWRS